MDQTSRFVAVGVGGALGASLRHLTSEVLDHDAGAFPWATLVVNLLGAFVLGLLLAGPLGRRDPHEPRRLLVATGLVAAATTFSTFALELVDLVDLHRYGVATAYLTATLVGGLAAVRGGTLVWPRVSR